MPTVWQYFRIYTDPYLTLERGCGTVFSPLFFFLSQHNVLNNAIALLSLQKKKAHKMYKITKACKLDQIKCSVAPITTLL